MTRLSEIKERLAKATKGEWQGIYQPAQYSICVALPRNKWEELTTADYEFITHSKKDLEWCVKVIEAGGALRKSLGTLEHRPDCEIKDGERCSCDLNGCLKAWDEVTK